MQVGLQFLAGDIVGGNARCVAMLMALRSMILDYETPPEKTLVRDLVSRTNNHVNFLISCRQEHIVFSHFLSHGPGYVLQSGYTIKTSVMEMIPLGVREYLSCSEVWSLISKCVVLIQVCWCNLLYMQATFHKHGQCNPLS